MAITPEEFVRLIDELTELLGDPRLLPENGARALVSVMGVSEEVLGSAFSALDGSPALQAALGATAAELHAERELQRRWVAAEQKLRALLVLVHNANLLRRHKLGRTGLQIYHIAKQLVRQPEHATLIPYMEEIESHIRRRWRGPRRKKTDTPAE